MAQENTARVITIAATERPQDIRLRVAAYARVSSSSDEQLNSFAAQNRYYTELISSKGNWQLVDIYADEGITGTSIEKRDDFKRMLRDCERGLIDRILVKSISRFARNTTECLETVRSLKARGVSVYFEKEGIDTGKVSGEMLTAVFASLAQAESEAISKNMRWSNQKRMQMGTFIPTHLPYGYCRLNYKIAIVDAEAEIVKRIFTWDVDDSIKLGLLEFTAAPVSITGKNLSPIVRAYILRNNLDQSDLENLYRSYVDEPQPIKKIIFNNAVDNITRITSAPQSVSAELLYDIIVSDAIADSYKVDLIVADIPHADQTEISRYLSALRLDEFVKIFDSRSRPKFENTSDNVAILNAFKARGWIYDYILDEAGYFKIRRHAPRLVSKTN